MFHSNGKASSSSIGSDTGSSFNTAPSPAGTNTPSSVEEIQTLIESSQPSEVPSLVLGQKSTDRTESISYEGSSGTSFIESSKDAESFYSTAKSSLDSRYRSETFYTATSNASSGSSGPSYSDDSSFYSDDFITQDNSSDSFTEHHLDNDSINPKDAERHFIKSKMRILASPQQRTEESPFVEPEDDLVSEEKRRFFTSHLRALKKRSKHGGRRVSDRANPQRECQSIRTRGDGLADVQVSRALVDRLKIENLLHSMRKFSSEPIHEPDKCKECTSMQQRVTETAFTKEKYRLVFNKYTEERYMTHIVTHDPLNEVGKLAAGLPKLSDDPQKIWDKLLQKGIT